jgi:hypothetical protein
MFLMKKKYKNLSVDQDLIKFVRIRMAECLNFYIYNKNMDIFRILIKFNEKS